MTYSQAQNRATQKYLKANLVQVGLRFKPEFREEIHQHIAYTGESLNKFIVRAVTETIARDKADMAKKQKAERKAKAAAAPEE